MNIFTTKLTEKYLYVAVDFTSVLYFLKGKKGSNETQLLVPLLYGILGVFACRKDETGHKYSEEVKELIIALMGKRACGVQALCYVKIS